VLRRRHDASIVSDDWVKGSSRSIPNCAFTTKRWGTRPETKYYGFWVIIFWLLTFLIPFLPFQHLWSYDLLVLCKSVIASHRCELFFETHTHTFNGPLSGTTRVIRYQKGETNLDFTEARDTEWQWHQLGHMQVCTLLQTDNHTSTPPLSFFTGRMPFLPPNQQCQSTEGAETQLH